MTCVWDALAKKIPFDTKKNKKKNISIDKLFHTLKENNKLTTDILCNNQELTQKQLQEGFERINSLKFSKINNGYDCSTCDPLLMLVAQNYNISIIHHFMDVKIVYKNKNFPNKVIYFSSSYNHFR